MKILILDNYDSFTYNLYQYVGEILEDTGEHFQLQVLRNDESNLEDIHSEEFDKIILSPGPGHPADPDYFGVCADVLQNLSPSVPTLGVCLGMQGIAHIFGGRVIRAELPMHGKLSAIEHDQRGVFATLPQNLDVMRYHSLVADPDSLPDELEISARVYLPGGKYEIMGLRHKKLPIEGIQFHPESFGTEAGKRMLQNFLFG